MSPTASTQDWILEPPLINLESSPPPLPPRKPSPPGPRKFGAAHASASSISSFHSVSLSSDLDNAFESFVNISAPKPAPPKPLPRSISSSTTSSTKTRRPPPPPPPPYQPRSRPSSSRASLISTSASTSDRSSILSNTTTTSRTSNSTPDSATLKSSLLLRPTPVPSAARSRYESLFDSALRGRRIAQEAAQELKLLSSPHRQAPGWRALSADLISSPQDHPVLSLAKGSDSKQGQHSSSEEKLNGRIAKHIWTASRLDRQKLKTIWNECDPQSTGFVDRDAFVRGMWRIDQELRRSQLAQRTSALTAASSQRIPHRPLPPPRPQRATQLLT